MRKHSSGAMGKVQTQQQRHGAGNHHSTGLTGHWGNHTKHLPGVGTGVELQGWHLGHVLPQLSSW